MAAPKKKRAREVQLGFEAISIEGGLLSPEWLSRIAQLNAGAQSESDYRIPKGLNLRDEIGRYWRIAQAHWNEFDAGLGANAGSQALAGRFMEALLRDVFGYASLVRTEPVAIAERDYPIGVAALNGRVPVVVAPAGTGLDRLTTTFGDGGRRRSAFGLAQEYLNAQDDALWGIASDGLALRVVRDNASLTRPAWIEADLQRVFTEERYADFAALWLLMHETRFGRADRPVTECALEVWRNAGREEGTRAREHLRRGVEDALLALGQGFIGHSENQQLRADLRGGSLSTGDYFNQLLRLVYRLIFLLTVEERGLLHASDASEEEKALYADGYSMRRLRDRSVKRSAHDRFSDIWEGTKVVLRGVASEEPRLGLSALAGIFAHGQCPNLDASKLENRALLLAVFRLAWLREDDSLVRVNWRDMGPEELGSVYESLLELVPQITSDGRQFSFATGSDTKGNARKTTGSYYTPDSLVQVLLDSALEPVIAETISKNPETSVEALLSLSIVDPACGSGHFLLAAARRLASHVARIRANGTPSAAEYRHALRQVVGRCIYGVDLNPMAVELCKVSLWMEAVEPGLPLTFLNSHIQHGNALLGTTQELMARGIPDDAWEPIEGDERRVASLLRKRNKAESGGQRTLVFTADPGADESRAISAAVLELEAASDANIFSLVNKETKWVHILDSPIYRHQKLVADAWCAAFVWPKQAGELADAAPTNERWRQIRDGMANVPESTTSTVRQLVEQYGFFHWQLQFPQVFAKGGFDVVLGNPPWERLKLQEKEWFASIRPDIASASNAAIRKKLIRHIEQENPIEWREYRGALRAANAEAHFARNCGRFPYGARGDVNTYALFADCSLSLLASRGRLGLVLPPGIATDDTYSDFFATLVEGGRLIELLGFINERKLFRGVLHNFKFVIFVASSGPSVTHATCVFNCFSVQEAKDPARRFAICFDDLRLLNPETRTCPVFFWNESAEITKRIYRRIPLLGGEHNDDGWGVKFWTMFHMSGDSAMFNREKGEDHTPLYEAKMIHQYNHRYASFGLLGSRDERAHMLPELSEAQLQDPAMNAESYYFVPRREVADRLGGKCADGWLVAVREVTSAGLERTLIATAMPPCGSNHKLLLLQYSPQVATLVPCLLACLNSIPLDFVTRQKLGGASLSAYLLRQLPVPPPGALREAPDWMPNRPLADWVLPRVLELSYTSYDMRAFARLQGCEGEPFSWVTERRFVIRCELDAAFFHVYGCSKDEVAYILDTFPVLRSNDQSLHGEYRTKDVILKIYDAMAEAAHTRKSYRSRLDPPPADPRVAHPPRTGVVVLFPRQTPAPRELPSWKDSIVAEAASRAQVSLDPDAWSTTWTGEALGMAALAAVLRNVVRPTARAEVERAVVLTVLPQLMQPNLKGDYGKQWRNAIGSNNLAVDSIGSLGIPWNAVLRKAIQQGVLVEDGTGNWAAGPDVGDAPSAALDARAIVVLSWLATMPAESSEVSSQVVALRAA